MESGNTRRLSINKEDEASMQQKQQLEADISFDIRYAINSTTVISGMFSASDSENNQITLFY